MDWGDGTTPTAANGTAKHTYTDAGTYTVSISGGLTRIHLGDVTSDRENDRRLQSIEQWGDITWSGMNEAFEHASNMVYSANDAPNLSGVTDMSKMFSGATDFNGNISGWDVSQVTDMSKMFSGATDFNGNISGWDVSQVTDMSHMFADATSFNGNISGWDVSKVTHMNRMFQSASSFNQDISSWDVSSVQSMFQHVLPSPPTLTNPSTTGTSRQSPTWSQMFSHAASFDKPLNDWDVSAGDQHAGYVQRRHRL